MAFLGRDPAKRRTLLAVGTSHRDSPPGSCLTESGFLSRVKSPEELSAWPKMWAKFSGRVLMAACYGSRLICPV